MVISMSNCSPVFTPRRMSAFSPSWSTVFWERFSITRVKSPDYILYSGHPSLALEIESPDSILYSGNLLYHTSQKSRFYSLFWERFSSTWDWKSRFYSLFWPSFSSTGDKKIQTYSLLPAKLSRIYTRLLEERHIFTGHCRQHSNCPLK